jgi:hypothetical protein
MKRLVAAFLRNRTVWQLVAIAAVCTSVALWMSFGLYQTTLKTLKPVLIVLWALPVVALILAFVRRAEDIKRAGDSPPTWWRLIAAILGLAGLITFVTISFAYHRRDMISRCNGSLLPETLEGRKQALAEAQATLRSPLAWLPRLVDDNAVRECERSRLDLERVERGLCTRWPIIGLACQCGEEEYPYARCPEPNCLYKTGIEHFDCPGDPIVEGEF